MLTVQGALQRVGGTLQLMETKTDRSRRTIRLPKIAVAALKAHRVRQLEEQLLAGTRWRETERVVTSTLGTFLEPRNINRQLEGLVEKAGLPHSRLHDLRQTCATLLLGQGVPPRMVMDLLGPSMIAVTMDTYSQMLPELHSEAADRMGSVLTREM
jgi:integrase